MNLKKQETKYLKPLGVGGMFYLDNVLFQVIVVNDSSYEPPKECILQVKVPFLKTGETLENLKYLEYLIPDNENPTNNEQPRIFRG